MAIKSFNEMMKLDLLEHISKKPTFKKDKVTGAYVKSGELDYLNWADCLMLLHQNGAEKVLFGNVRSAQDHPLFLAIDKAPFVRAYVEIDGDRRELDYPVIDGSTDISMERLMQSDIHNATQRGFVKCVAINWGLGLSLWQKEDELPKSPKDDLSIHNIYAIKERIERLLTSRLQDGIPQRDLLAAIGMSERNYKNTMDAIGNIALLEKKLREL